MNSSETEVRITLRLPLSLQAELKDLAAETRRSLNAMIVTILERALDVEPFTDDLRRR